MAKKTIIDKEWDVGFRDRGLGRGDFAVIVKKGGELVVECPTIEIAQHIVRLHNLSLVQKEVRA